MTSNQQFLYSAHQKFFKRCLHYLPGKYASSDQQRLALFYFLLNGLDSLSAINQVLSPEDQNNFTDYIYNYLSAEDGGFYLSSTFNNFLEDSHLTATYSAIICLLILNDDLSGINRRKLLSSLRKFQNPVTGEVACTPSGESDMRFMFCLFSIYYILQGDQLQNFDKNFKTVDIQKSVNYILNCQTYEGGFAQKPGLEAHGGSTFCALSCLKMSSTEIPNYEKLVRFLVTKQEKSLGLTDFVSSSGFVGRTNKIADTCYTFWVGSCIRLLSIENYIDQKELENFLYECQQDIIGGFNKNRGMDSPDPLHSCLSLLGAGNFENLFKNQVQPTVGDFSATFSVNQRIKSLKFNNLMERDLNTSFEDCDESLTAGERLKVLNQKLGKNNPSQTKKSKKKSKTSQKPAIKLLKSVLPSNKSVLTSIAIGLLAYMISVNLGRINKFWHKYIGV